MADEPAFGGLKVFDASQGVAAPHCAMLLAQHGADVVKLEPLTGDWGRVLGKSFGDHSPYALVKNRGKRSIALDLKTPQGQEIAQRLAAEADVMLQNFRPGVMARFGLDYDSVHARNPNVVYFSLTGFGATGTYSNRPATDMVLQAFSGWMTINRDPSGKPQRVNMVAIDVVSGLYAFQAVSAALYRRAMKGGGAHIEMSLMEAAAALQSSPILEYHLGINRAEGIGVPIGAFKTRDGYININARRDPVFAKFCKLIGREELIEDPRFKTPQSRVENESELLALIDAAIGARTTAEWDAALTELDILHAPVNDYGDYLADAHVQQADVVSWVEHDSVGTVPMTKIPGLPPAETGNPLSRAPHIGEHSAEILQSLGYTEDAIAALRAENIVGVYDPDTAPANAGVSAP
ncbi:MAG: CoA transferase [Alphaproteobacteria bacterium]|nr:CoA transferase [Alphaproteobacteria bacterium]